jgi:hypothetical protein
VVAAIAPTLGAALGGPLGGTAGAMIAKAIGKPDAPDEEIAQTLETADPETLLKLKQAEIEFQQFLKDADIKIQTLENADRADARSREVSLHDRTPAVLAGVVMFGFFSVFLWLLKYGMPGNVEQPVLISLGTLGSGFVAILNYYFGSSASSRNKDAAINSALKVK